MSHIPHSSTDIVFIDTLHLSANVGPDCWGRSRAQPVSVTVNLQLKPGFLKTSGTSDAVGDSVHYGLLTKRVAGLEGREFNGVCDLIAAVAQEAFDLGGENVDAVRVVVELPKVVLLAVGYVVDATVTRERRVERKSVSVRGVVVPIVIGVNPPERLAKQRVVTDLVFYEREGAEVGHAEYQRVVNVLVKVRYEKSICWLCISACVSRILKLRPTLPSKSSCMSSHERRWMRR